MNANATTEETQAIAAERQRRHDERLFRSEHGRRIRRIQTLAERIGESARVLKLRVDDVAPDDLKGVLDVDDARSIERWAAEIRRLDGEIEALRSVAYLIEGGAR